MNTKHTSGQWRKSKSINDYSIYSENNHNNDIATVFQYSRSIPEDEAEANAKLIAAAPELLEMVNNLKNCIARLCHDRVTQIDRDTEANWIGEAHELLQSINPDYYQNANTATE